MSTTSNSVYFAGELFSLKHLLGNALLAEAIELASAGRYKCVVPQDLEQRETTATAIRNQDLLQVVNCDFGLFHFDGPELDSGTVVEFIVAKMLDIPSVIVRSDFRSGGDAKTEPWNLMVSGYPRTEVIVFDSMGLYQGRIKRGAASPSAAASAITEELAARITGAFDRVRELPPVMTAELRSHVYDWMRLFPGAGFEMLLSQPSLAEIVESKVTKGLL